MKFLEFILIDLVNDLKDGEFGTYQERSLLLQSVDRVEVVLAQCILSSGWRYDRAGKAGLKFSREIGKKYRSKGTVPISVVTAFLNHEDVRHRFPNKKAEQLKLSFEKLWTISHNKQLDLSSYDCEKDLRDFFVRNFPGLGLKQASMFLRDAGFTNNLAIIDTHVIWYFNNVRGQDICSQSKARYLKAEKKISQFCFEVGVPIGLIDILIWNLVKCYKHQAEKQRCQKQFVSPPVVSTPQLAFTY